MSRTSTISAREFNQHVSRAKRAAKDGPVIITERGKPAFVLMEHSAFVRDKVEHKKPMNALEALTDPNASDMDVEFPRLKMRFRDVELD
jgi:prevent-host-death family protein